MIASGKMFGPHQSVILHLLDIPPMEQALKGVEMEILDCAFPLVKGIVATSDLKTAFTLVGNTHGRYHISNYEMLLSSVELSQERREWNVKTC
jgi:hypothetical protein